MAKIRFKKINTRNPLLFSTSVENMFISELLPAAPGDYVKVYLFGLMNAGFGAASGDSGAVFAVFASSIGVPNISSIWLIKSIR